MVKVYKASVQAFQLPVSGAICHELLFFILVEMCLVNNVTVEHNRPLSTLLSTVLRLLVC